MSGATIATLLAVVGTLTLCCPLVGPYLAAVFAGAGAPGDRFAGPIERVLFKLVGASPGREQRWPGYAISIVAFSGVSVVVLYGLLRLQGSLPFNPTDVPGMRPWLAFNTAVSFVTGTDWQAYAGEAAMSHLSQMVGLVVAQFTAGAVGIAVAMALVRGLARRSPFVGNFWVDAIRAVVRVLVPLAVVSAVVLVALGTVQNLGGNEVIATVEGGSQVVPGGPVATQVVAKTMASNGGGFFNANSAHPFDNPNGLTNAVQLFLCLILPFSLPFAYGRLVGDRRQGRVLLVVMAVLWIIPLTIGVVAETSGNTHLPADVAQAHGDGQAGGNMEGKDVRFGPGGSGLLTLGSMGTTAGIASSGIGSYTPAGQSGALVPILLGEVAPGGVGGGLVGMLLNVLLATFFAGLMTGRTPSYLGNRLRQGQTKLIMLAILIVPIVVLGVAAAAVTIPSVRATTSQDGPHGLTEILYAAASATNGNGSAVSGLDATGSWWTITLGIAMLAARYLVIVPALALAGSFANQPKHDTGSLDTTSTTFTVLVLAVVLIVGGLTFLPALALSVIQAAVA